MFAGDIISRYWIKLMVIKAVSDLENHLFHQKTEIEGWYLKTASLWSAIPIKDPYDELALVYFRYSIDHLNS